MRFMPLALRSSLVASKLTRLSSSTLSVGVYQGSDKHRILREYKMGWYDIIIVGFETVSRDIHEVRSGLNAPRFDLLLSPRVFC